MSRAKLSGAWCRPADIHHAAAGASARRSAAAKIANRARNAKLSPAQRKAATEAATAARWVNRTPEEIFESSSRGARARWARMSEDQRAAFGRAGGRAATAKMLATTTPEQRRALMSKLAKARWAKERARRARDGVQRYCQRCEEMAPTKDDGITCARCALVLP